MTDLCPFCKTELPDGATVCAGCGARKTIRGASGGQLGRFMLWCNTFGVLLIVWLVVAPHLLWRATFEKWDAWRESMTWAERWAERAAGTTDAEKILTFLQTRVDWTQALLSLSVIIVGWWVYKAASWIWVKIFGRLSDEVWVR